MSEKLYPFRPMLAAATDGEGLRYPLFASPKLDGVRATVIGGILLTRSLKPVPNKALQARYGVEELEGLDGELVSGSSMAKDCFRCTTSAVMSHAGAAEDVHFYVFDCHREEGRPFRDRLVDAQKVVYSSHDSNADRRVSLIVHEGIRTSQQLEAYEAATLRAGYEGVMLRDPDAPYKRGRSTESEGWLLKLKRFEDGEAQVLGAVEQLHNANEAKLDERGFTKRSHKQAGMVGTEILGALSVKDTVTGVTFEIGSGFTRQDRVELWAQRATLAGKLVKYKFFPTGSKDKPRFPTFVGFRDKRDV